MDSPPELSQYLLTNTPLPHELKPTLGLYLAQVSSTIASLDAEIDQLERVLDAKKRQREKYRKGYEKHFQLQSPIRNIPPEIWGIIFGFTLDDKPFGRLEYRTYGFLRQVCTTWRDVVVATPNLCRGLVVHMDGPLAQSWYSNEKGTQHKLGPWLAILSRNHPYHLVLGVEDDEALDNLPYDVADVCVWIFTTVPTPTILTITNSEVFRRNIQITHLTLDFGDLIDQDGLEEPPLENFPYLNTLVINPPMFFDGDWSHTGIQFLTLADVCGSAEDFALFLLNLPSLRELKIDSEEFYLPPDHTPSPFTPLIHPTLEILLVGGEDLLLMLNNITFPSLKYFGLASWGSYDYYEILVEIVPAFFQRCSLNNKNFTAVVRGTPSSFIFDLLMHSMPRSTRLHLDMDIGWGDESEETEIPPIHAQTVPWARTFSEIFSSQRLDELDWLRDNHDAPGSEPIKLYIPKDILDRHSEEGIKMHRDKLGDCGYELQVLQLQGYRDLLQSSIPKMTLGWKA
ncbi:hypothetical protein BKA70DRAFT_1399157 [Coprinopsis sp. MPI-PUGE-AT-0042]|nr:hypothetical protein BKA70DRAFT_1399157 [Coprinopsis sp. MPI-PUGE-AT-0042]